MREEHPNVLTLDAGDFGLNDNPNLPGGWAVTEYVAGILDQIGIDAWTPGERELLHGRERVGELRRRLKGAAVSANVHAADGGRLFDDRAVRTVGKLKVGITGITSPAALGEGKGLSDAQRAVAAEYRVDDPAASLKPIVAALGKSCDLVILLAHATPSEAAALVEAVPDIDLVVVAHNPGAGYEGETYGRTWVMRTGVRGQLAPLLSMTVGADGSLSGVTSRFDALIPGMPHDADMQTRIDLFETSIKSLRDKAPRPRGPGQLLRGGGAPRPDARGADDPEAVSGPGPASSSGSRPR